MGTVALHLLTIQLHQSFGSLENIFPSTAQMKRFQFNSADLDITITNDNPRTFYNCKTFDADLLNGDFWHMIVVSNE